MSDQEITDEQRKQKAEAAAKAREERRKAREASGETPKNNEELSDEQKQLKREAAAKAREERRKARESKTEDAAKTNGEEAVKPPSPNQPLLDQVMQILNEVGDGAIEESYINEADRHLPCIVVSADTWAKCARKLKENTNLPFHYLRNVSGVDYETHMEVVYHILSLHTGQDICVKVRTNREEPTIPSVTPIWTTANWPEREIYDLLGIHFPGHPDLRRIMMPDDWIGHPLRKDYEAFDPEV